MVGKLHPLTLTLPLPIPAIARLFIGLTDAVILPRGSIDDAVPEPHTPFIFRFQFEVRGSLVFFFGFYILERIIFSVLLCCEKGGSKHCIIRVIKFKRREKKKGKKKEENV